MSKRRMWIELVPPELCPAAAELCSSVLAEYPLAVVGVAGRFESDDFTFRFRINSEKWGKELEIRQVMSPRELESANYRGKMLKKLFRVFTRAEAKGPPKETWKYA